MTFAIGIPAEIAEKELKRHREPQFYVIGPSGGATTFNTRRAAVRHANKQYYETGQLHFVARCILAVGSHPEAVCMVLQWRDEPIMDEGLLREAEQAAPVKLQIPVEQTASSSATAGTA